MSTRDDFSSTTKELLAKRVGYKCSNPGCSKGTIGPSENPKKTVNIGVAAHITSASKGGKRYNPNLTPSQRSDFNNGIWLCQNCGKLIDNDEIKYTIELIYDWKKTSEKKASIEVEKSSAFALNYELREITIANKNQLKKEDFRSYNFESSSFHESRYIQETNNEIKNIFFEDKNNRKSLQEYSIENNKIVLLGNPGIGKTRELEKLFENIWADESFLVPILINLKNFRSVNKFEDIIPYKNWNTLNEIIFILDGLDEIADIPNFLSEFETFNVRNKETYIKYVFSCRTNIYNKYLASISDLKPCFLIDLNIDQAKSILKNKFQITLSSIEIDSRQLEYFKTPFFLNLFAEYYKENLKFPESDAEMWELYINRGIEQYKIKQSKKTIVSAPKLIHELKLVACINELMRKNFILEDDLFKIFEGEYTNFLENPFINSDKNNLNSWSFIHRQIQEYFVAKALVGKKTLVVQEVISIPNTKIIHPSLFNTVTFLINLLPKNSEEFTGLLNWIKENQPELLFNADSDRIGNDLRVTIFQPYFKKECIDKTLWINTNKSYTVEEIAAFANCDANAEYLLNIIKAPQNNIRARISAINILEHFTFPVAKQFVLKEELLQLLKNANLELQIKAEIIDLINLQKICETDQEYLTQIFILFQDESNKELNRALLSLLDSQKDIDLHFDYIKREFLWDNGIIERETIDKVHRGNNWTLQSLILKLTNPENFIDIIYYHFSEEYNIQLNDDFANEISTKLIEFIGNDKNIAIDFFAKFNPKTKFHKHDNLLRNIILKSNSQIEVFKFIFNANEFSEVYYFLAQIAHLESIELVIQKYTTDEITENLESFRNVIGNTNSLELAEVFNNKMQVAGFNFIGKFFNSAEVAKLEEIHSKKPQDNFDVLFNQDELLSKIEKLFTSNSGVIDSKKIHEIEIEWYKKKGHWNTIIDNEIALTRFLIMKYRKQLDFNTIKTLLNDSDSLFEYIRIVIERSESYRNKIQITKNQKNVIINWCKVASDRIKFDNVIKLHNTQSFSKLPDYETLKLIQFYQSKLDFKLPKVFLLNTLEFYGMENSEDDASLVELFNKIEDEKAFNEQITNNIKNKQLFSITLNKHVYYAIENNLTATFNIIREYFKDDNIIYLSEGIFEKYISHSKDFSLLKECSINTHSRICWSALKILVDQNIDNLFCINKSLEYLSKKESNLFASEALGILFRLNRIEAIEYLYEFFVEKTSIHLTVNQFGNYSVENYDLIDKLFREICFDDSDSFRFMSNRAIFSNYIYNLSKKEESYLKVQEILKGIGNDKNITDSGLFYINLELDNSTNSYINSQSIPLDFEDALKKAKEIVT